MTAPLDLPTALWDFVIVNLSFMLGLLLLRGDRVWDGARFWIAGNMAVLASIGLRLWLYRNPSLAGFALGPPLLLVANHLLKVLALSHRRDRFAATLAGAGIIALYVAAAWVLRNNTGINVVIGGAGCCLAVFIGWQAIICFRNPRWRGLRGSVLFIATNGVASIYALIVGLRGFDVPREYVIFPQTNLAQANLSASMAYIIVVHICLIAMLMARLDRIASASRLRARRQLQLARQANAHAEEMAALAREKQSLLEVLIHEVRQPLNNAQAALQGVMMSLRADSRDHAAGGRLQTIIDRIVLSLSNAIVGASVLERQRQSSLVTTDIASICQLACSDAGPDWLDRIDFTRGESGIFAQADPILLRLAVRNLIDNALKHAATATKAGVLVVTDEASMAVRISVTNRTSAPFTPTDDLFRRGVRGANATSQGSGLGLYIVQEIARLHQGHVEATAKADGVTRFDLVIPV